MIERTIWQVIGQQAQSKTDDMRDEAARPFVLSLVRLLLAGCKAQGYAHTFSGVTAKTAWA